MTREEAIEKLKGFDLIGSNEDIEFQEALDEAIKLLEQEPILDKTRRANEEMNVNEKKMEQENYKSTKYYRNLLLMYHEFFDYDELFTFTVNLFDSIADVDVKKLALVFKGIEEKIKKLEGVE